MINQSCDKRYNEIRNCSNNNKKLIFPNEIVWGFVWVGFFLPRRENSVNLTWSHYTPKFVISFSSSDASLKKTAVFVCVCEIGCDTLYIWGKLLNPSTLVHWKWVTLKAEGNFLPTIWKSWFFFQLLQSTTTVDWLHASSLFQWLQLFRKPVPGCEEGPMQNN